MKSPLVRILIALGAVLALAAGVTAQDGDVWSEPVNLSRSGAAEAPVVVAGPGGALQAFWWDRFDGLTTAYFDGESWGAPAFVPITWSVVVGEEFEIQELEAMPRIVGGAGAYAHAWWLGAPDEDTGLRPLMHSRLGLGTRTWSAPEEMAESVLSWEMIAGPGGGLHLVYVRPTHSETFPAGIYYKGSANAGASWSAPEILYDSIYFRLLTEEEAHVAAAATAGGEVFAAWDDPRVGALLVTSSADGGATWGEAVALEDEGDLGPRRPRLAPAGDGALLLWEASRGAASACALYQQRTLVTDEVVSWSAPQRVLEELNSCPGRAAFSPLSGDEGERVVMAGGRGTGGLALAVWDGPAAGWSLPKPLGFAFENPDTGAQVYPGELGSAVTDGGRLAVVGLGQDGEVWALHTEVAALELAFAPPPEWAEPQPLGEGAAAGVPAVALDGEGTAHVLWADDEGVAYGRVTPGDDRMGMTTRSTSVAAGASEPALVALGDRLHGAWVGEGGAVLAARAYARDAYAAGGWGEPAVLTEPGAWGGAPALATDLGGGVHAAYAVPFNEGRGVYYGAFDAAAGRWSGAERVFDAAAEGWTSADRPDVAVDESGVAHLVWVKASAPGEEPEGIYYARQAGEGWSQAQIVAEGAYDGPRIAATLDGQVHVTWLDLERGGVGHRWKPLGGEWTYVTQVPGFRDVAGPADLTADGSGALHAAALTADEAGEPTLIRATWDGTRWETESARLPGVAGLGEGASVALAADATLGRLEAAFVALSYPQAEGTSEERPPLIPNSESLIPGVFHTGRAVPTADAVPAYQATPVPTPTPAPVVPTPTPTPRPELDPGAPPQANAVELGPVTLPILALGGMALAVVVVGAVIAVWSLKR